MSSPTVFLVIVQPEEIQRKEGCGVVERKSVEATPEV